MNSEGSGRAGSPEPSLVAYVISTIISCAGSIDLRMYAYFGVRSVSIGVDFVKPGLINIFRFYHI